MGNREGGASRPRMVEKWANNCNFDYEFYCSNPNDTGPTTGDLNERDAIRQFLNEHRHHLSKVVIFQQGHGRHDGAWIGAKFEGDPITPVEVCKMAGGNEKKESEITIVSGAGCGGQWLEYFEGITAASPDKTNSGFSFWDWLFKESDAWPRRDPNQRGLGRFLYPDAHQNPHAHCSPSQQ